MDVEDDVEKEPRDSRSVPAEPATAWAPSQSTPSGSGASDPRERVFTLTMGAVLGTAAAASVGVAVRPMFFGLVRNHNEGWNAYWQSSAAIGGTLYPNPPTLTWNNYPPLGFYITGILGRLTGDQIAAGRVLSLVCFLVTAGMVGAIAARLGGSRSAGLVSTFLTVLIFGSFYSNYVGMNDPQFLAHVLMTAAVWVALRGAPTRTRVVVVVSLMTLALSVKHNLLPFPLAYAAWLLFDVRKRRGTIVVVASVAVALWLLMPVAVFGHAYLAELLASRQYSLSRAAHGIPRSVIKPLTLPLALAAGWGIAHWRNRNPTRLILLYLVLSLCLAAAFAGGSGVNYNCAFDVAFAACMAAGPGVVELGHELRRRRLRGRRTAPAALAVIFLAFSLHQAVTASPTDSGPNPGDLSRAARATSADIAYLSTTQGRAACTTLALCQRAGKAFEIDFFNSWEAVVTHRMPYAMLERPFTSHSMAVVQLPPDFPAADSSFETSLAQTLHRAGYRRDRLSPIGQYWVPSGS